MSVLSRVFRKFLRDEEGTLLVEAVLVLPFLLWAYISLFVYWDTYRAINTVQKAAYTISDMLSREMVAVNDAYIKGMDKMMEYMIDGDQDAKIRVTSLTWSELNRRYEVHWSRSADNELPQLTTATLQPLTDHIPRLADGDYVVLVEVEVDYHPSFNVGINDQTLRQFIVTRPRFVPKTCLVGVACT